MQPANLHFAIQGELGSNSHMAAFAMAKRMGTKVGTLVPCVHSDEVFRRLADGSVTAAVLPIENSLHGSVAEHYDLLLRHSVTIQAESFLPIRHNVIAVPGTLLPDVRRVLSHPVALSQCRRWFAAHPEVEPVPFYDTAGAVKHIMSANLPDTAALAPELAATEYAAQILLPAIEDHAENYTRFYLLAPLARQLPALDPPNKLSLALGVQHRPGTLVAVLNIFRDRSLNLTRIESRPVPGTPWEYIFFVDLLFETPSQIDDMLPFIQQNCVMVKELGRYRAA